MNIDALLDAARLPERTVTLCLRGDLQADFEELQRQLTKAQDAPRDSIDDGGDAVELAEQIEALRGQMESHTVTFRMRALPRRRWRELWTAHPGRDGDNRDRVMGGVNMDTFPEALLRECCIEPALTPGQWDRILDTISDQQYDDLATMAWNANRSSVDVPFSPAASRILRNSAPE